MIYFSDYSEFDPKNASPDKNSVPLSHKSDNVINFPSSDSPTEQEISKWVNLLVHQCDEIQHPSNNSSKDATEDASLNVLAEALLDKGVL